MAILSEEEYDETAETLKEVELLIEQAADQEDYDSVDYYVREQSNLKKEMRLWKQ